MTSEVAHVHVVRNVTPPTIAVVLDREAIFVRTPRPAIFATAPREEIAVHPDP